MPFPRLLALCETQTALFTIWNQVVRFISHDINHYAMIVSLITNKYVQGNQKKQKNRTHKLFYYFYKNNAK